MAQEKRVDSLILVDQLEHGFTKSSDTLRFNALGWVGGDYNRLWINTEGNRTANGSLDDTDVQVLYGRLIAPFGDLQGGVRYFQPQQNGPKRGSAVFGIQGLAPYRFEVQAAGFVSNRGEVSARVEIEYDLRLTQTLIAQPCFKTNIAVQRAKELGIGRGINDAYSDCASAMKSGANSLLTPVSCGRVNPEKQPSLQGRKGKEIQSAIWRSLPAFVSGADEYGHCSGVGTGKSNSTRRH